MKIQHDFHNHTYLSLCAQKDVTAEYYAAKARELKLVKFGFSDHMWDAAIPGAIDWYAQQSFRHIALLKEELSKTDTSGLVTYFGCETEYDYLHRGIALTEDTAAQLDFILVSNSHTHITMPKDFYLSHQKHADFMLDAFMDIMNSRVSRYVTAIAHPFSAVECPYDNRELYPLISDAQFRECFTAAREKNIAVELNCSSLGPGSFTRAQLAEHESMRMFYIAKECGCQFLFGSDSHTREDHECYLNNASHFAELLELKEEDIADIAR